jgi:hypothetical protein
MSKKVFDYNGITSIGIEAPLSLLERIARNIEGEIPEADRLNSDCQIKINESLTPVEIEKDKRYPYLTIRNIGSSDRPSVEYTRYNTPVRVIHHKSDQEYLVDTNIRLDESAGLICLRNYLSNHPQLSSLPLLHASLLSLNGRGILIVGNSKEGKTTLAVYLLQEQKADFVSDENVILENRGGRIRGLYIPRTPRIRFSAIAESRLSEALNDIKLTDATQYIDQDAINRIISTKSFHVDAGLAFSRQSLCNLLGVGSRESELIDTIILPKYNEGGFYVRDIAFDQGMDQLSRSGLKRKLFIDPKELEETTIDLSSMNLKNVEFIEVGFSDFKCLRKGGFRL